MMVKLGADGWGIDFLGMYGRKKAHRGWLRTVIRISINRITLVKVGIDTAGHSTLTFDSDHGLNGVVSKSG